ncbi:MAG TPA: hypothetical protein VH684_13570 [Xanthobacteraceae bacterium]|jgi:hypothetical protein
MPYRRTAVSLALAPLLISLTAPAHAFDESKYPNWKGQWIEPGVNRTSPWDTTLPGPGEQALLTPQYQAVLAASIKAEANGGPPLDPTSRCMPAGMPRMMMALQPLEIVITPRMTYFMFAALESLRRIYTDGRTFQGDIEPSFTGTSIGHWQDSDGDGRFDTLLIETRAIRGPHTYDASGIPFHKDGEATVTEKIYADKADPNILRDEITTNDHALKEPWTVTRRYRRSAEAQPEWGEVACKQNASRVLIGDQYYSVSPEGLLMPAVKGQKRPDLKYFK